MAAPVEPVGATGRSAELPAECIYVYGMVDAVIHPGLLQGAARGAQLELTTVGRVAAVHSWIDPAQLQDMEPEIAEGSRLAQLVRKHDEVVTALALAGPVLPARLGTLLPDVGSLSKILGDTEDSIADGLERVRGRAEWDLRVTSPELPEAAPDGEPVLAHSGRQQSGTAYLLGRREARRRAAQLRGDVYAAVTGVDECLAGLADESTGTVAADPHRPVARAYLVQQERQDEFVAAGRAGVTELERLGCAAALRGPLPAYSFADVRLEAFRND
jgi:hypothetical protein